MSLTRLAARLAPVTLMLVLASACGSGRSASVRQAQDAATPVALADKAVVGVTSEKTHELGDGVTVRELVLDRNGVAMTVWIYRPARPAPAAGRPVVLIGAAGTPLFWGMALGDGDRAEHLPWAKQGYLVVAYSLDGHVANAEDDAQTRAGVRAFLGARAGLDNAEAALSFALAHEPGLDGGRIYAVGHSSAATLALRVGAEDARVKAIVAFNPITDVEWRVGEAMDSIVDIAPRARAVLRASSPMSHIQALRGKPVFLFHSAEDATVPAAESQRLADAMKPAHAASRHLVVPTGDHYQSMLTQGVPAAVTWLEEVGGGSSAGK